MALLLWVGDGSKEEARSGAATAGRIEALGRGLSHVHNPHLGLQAWSIEWTGCQLRHGGAKPGLRHHPTKDNITRVEAVLQLFYQRPVAFRAESTGFAAVIFRRTSHRIIFLGKVAFQDGKRAFRHAARDFSFPALPSDKGIVAINPLKSVFALFCFSTYKDAKNRMWPQTKMQAQPLGSSLVGDRTGTTGRSNSFRIDSQQYCPGYFECSVDMERLGG